MTDREAQQEELVALESIFPELLSFDDEHKISLRIKGIRLAIYLPEQYPSEEPPHFEISAPALSVSDKLSLQNELNAAYLDNLGMPVLYTWATVLQDFVASQTPEPVHEEKSDCSDESSADKPEVESARVPDIVSSCVTTDRKSVFQAHMARIQSKDEVDLVMAKLLENNKIARATHNILAWCCNEERNGKLIKCKDCKDDGETGASSKMLELLELMGAENVMVVVTRWYGGIHLGPDRFRIINNMTRDILARNGLDKRAQTQK